jgi:DNA-binding beta-propeller fold protein YncE
MRSRMLIALLACSACGNKDNKDKPSPPSNPSPGSSAAQSAPPAPAPTPTSGSRITLIALPGGGSDGVSLDYLTFDARTNTVWVPAGGTGAVDVVDTATRKVTQVDGFPTKEMERDGKTHKVGPSCAAAGDDFVYVGDRADHSVCAIAEQTLKRDKCTTLNESPDSILYSATTHQLWVTTPRDNSVRILDAATLAQTARVELPGAPEGFAIDAQNGRYYTNLEDKDQTEVIDINSHQVVATWKPDCGEAGPRGLRVDSDAGLLFVACTTKVHALSIHNGGQVVGSVDAGEGVDDLDYSAKSHQLFIAAGKAGKLVVATVDGNGALAVKDVIPTQVGARNGVVDANGVVYLAHGAGSELLAVDTRAR